MGGSRARIHRRLVSTIAIGIDGSASRIHIDRHQWLLWGGPYMMARMGRSTLFTARLGTSYRRYDAAAGATAFTQQSYFGVAQLHFVPASRWNLSGHVYASRSRFESTHPVGVGSLAEYAWSDHLSLGAEVVAEWFGAETTNWRSAASAAVEMTDAASWSVRLGMQQFRDEDGSSTDVFVSLGFTYRLQGRRDLTTSPPALWTREKDEMVLRFTYQGDGVLYLVGDFNDWRVGEFVLRKSSRDIYTTSISVPPGTYEYRIMALDGDVRRWLPLPENALTTDDNFGGTNGILLVE